jgi:hypothetical protein
MMSANYKRTRPHLYPTLTPNTHTHAHTHAHTHILLYKLEVFNPYFKGKSHEGPKLQMICWRRIPRIKADKRRYRMKLSVQHSFTVYEALG